MIIGLVGKKRSGKDTVADWLVKHYGFTKYSLANPMKEAVKEIFLMTEEQVNGDEKEVIDHRWGISPRKILQVMGTELFQYDIYNHIPELLNKVPARTLWITRFRLWYKMDTDCVVSDVRFPHEADEIKKLGGIIIRVYRKNLPDDDKHASETEMEEIKHNHMIFNYGTIEELKKKINKLMGEMYWDTYTGS